MLTRRFSRSVLRIAFVVSLLALPLTARAETFELKKGDPAPSDGVLFDADAASEFVWEHRDRETLKSELETEKAIVAAKDSQIAAQQQIIELKDQQIALKQQEIDMHVRVEEHMEQALLMSEKAANVAINAAEKSNAALEKMTDKLEAANKRGFWGTILGALGAFFIGKAF